MYTYTVHVKLVKISSVDCIKVNLLILTLKYNCIQYYEIGWKRMPEISLYISLQTFINLEIL